MMGKTFNIILKFFIVSTLVAHVWATILVSFKENIFWGIATFFLPFVSETYWVIRYFWEEPVFVIYTIFHLLLSFIYSLPGTYLRKI